MNFNYQNSRFLVLTIWDKGKHYDVIIVFSLSLKDSKSMLWLKWQFSVYIRFVLFFVLKFITIIFDITRCNKVNRYPSLRFFNISVTILNLEIILFYIFYSFVDLMRAFLFTSQSWKTWFLMIDYLYSYNTHTLEKNIVNMLVLIISLRQVHPFAKKGTCSPDKFIS